MTLYIDWKNLLSAVTQHTVSTHHGKLRAKRCPKSCRQSFIQSSARRFLRHRSSQRLLLSNWWKRIHTKRRQSHQNFPKRWSMVRPINCKTFLQHYKHNSKAWPNWRLRQLHKHPATPRQWSLGFLPQNENHLRRANNGSHRSLQQSASNDRHPQPN